MQTINNTVENTTSKSLDHLGLVRATIDKLGLIEKIDKVLPMDFSKGAKTTTGQRVAAMILNGLGFMDTRLYMFPDFMEKKPTQKLFGENIKAEDFNEHSLGRALDRIHKYSPTKLFSDLAFQIGSEHNLIGRSFNIDTTSLSVYGEYEGQDPTEEFKVTYGYSKAKRPDLKQVVLNLATTGEDAFPLFMESLSGNTSDQKELHKAAQTMQELYKSIEKTPNFLYVADSAMHSKCSKNPDLLWLTRAPESNKWVKELISCKDQDYAWQALPKGYKQCVLWGKMNNIVQRVCIIHSEQAYKREIKTWDRKLEKLTKKLETEIKKLNRQEFNCTKDAKDVTSQIKKKLKFHTLNYKIEEIKKHPKKGRPKGNEEPTIVGYKLNAKLTQNQDKITLELNKKGKFVLVTNELNEEELPNDKILDEYKGQAKTESGFKFIKDNAFEVSSIFLKKPERISALMMIMTLCLMVYNIAYKTFKEGFKNIELTDKESKKVGKKPSIKRIFKLFCGVSELTVRIEKEIKVLVINVSSIMKKIIKYFGSKACLIYAIPT